ncbi:MAG: polyhydroxyalkanoate depolymerase, partial [Rhizobacter sp.]
LCTGIPKARQFHYDVEGAGHYGIFSGRRWREKVYPTLRDFIATHQAGGAPKAAAKRPARKAATKAAAPARKRAR